MVFGKLFKKKDSTDNLGNNIGNLSESGSTHLSVYITASGHPDSPSVEISKKITVGSEVGELVVDDESISPRHCSFFLNQNVISIMDHSSVEGTFINKKKIDSGKIIILNEKDKIKLGKIEFLIEYLAIPVEDTTLSDDFSESGGHFEDSTMEFSVMGTQGNVSENLSEEVHGDDPNELPTQTLARPSQDVLNSGGLAELSLETRENLISQVEEEVSEDDQLNEQKQVFERKGINVDDIDVEEEDLDENILPIAVRQEHDKILAQREQAKAEIQENDFAPMELNKKKSKDSEGDLGLEGNELHEISGMEDSEEDSEGFFGGSKKKALKSRKGRGSAKRGKSETKKKSRKSTADPSSSFITRSIASLYDAAICLIILEIFLVYKDFEKFYTQTHLSVWEVLRPHYDKFLLPYYKELIQKVPDSKQVFDFVLELENVDKYLSFLVLFFVTRSIFALFFSVSLGQFLIGIRAKGKFLWKRVVYPFREILGYLLFPFLIFDIPALFSKRTFKEIITFSQLQTPKPKMSFLSSVVVIPLLVFLYGVAPFVKGLEISEAVNVEVNNSKQKPYSIEKPIYIESQNISVAGNDDIKILPAFSLKTIEGKKILHTGVMVLDLRKSVSIDLIKVKEFNIDELYTSFVSKNILSKHFQPAIYKYVKGIELSKKPDFKQDKIHYKELTAETKSLIGDTYQLEPIFFFEQFVWRNGFVMSGFRDLREKLDNLFLGDVEKIEFTTLGKTEGILAQFNEGRESSYNFVPLGQEQGKMYASHSRLSSKNTLALRNKFFIGKLEVSEGEDQLNTDHPIAQFINNANSNERNENEQMYTAIYETYFGVIQHYLKNSRLTKNLAKYLQQFLDILEYKSSLKNLPFYKKEILRFSELSQSLKDKNYEFFKISPPRVDVPSKNESQKEEKK